MVFPDASSKSPICVTADTLAFNHVREIPGYQAETQPTISVYVATFNHRDYIDCCMNSIFSQVTNYTYEVVVSDDCSNDGTAELLNRWQKKFPNKIRLFCSNKNLWAPAPGVFGVTSIKALSACRGKYLATIDGDDYFISTNKLQHDVTFLESSPEYNVCFHNAFFDAAMDERRDRTLCIRNEFRDRDFSFAELAANFIPPTSGLLMRNPIKHVINQDWVVFSKLRLIGICLSSLGDGKARYFAEPMSAYRLTTSGQASSEMHPGRHLDDLLAHFGMLYGALNVGFQFKQHGALSEGLKKNIERLVESHCRHNGFRRLEETSVLQLVYVLLSKICFRLLKGVIKKERSAMLGG